ncbi:MAG: hypothetical protein KGZ69_16905 [Methylomonas sp.]|nr:hypothetical protein [Methylomonas sp.]
MSLSKDFEAFLTDQLGFWRSDFCGHPEGHPHFEPAHHMTQKPKDGKEHRALIESVLAHAEKTDAMLGYIEGEFIPLDEDIPERPYDPSIQPPFKIHRTTLPAGSFREDEIHITLSRDESDPGMIQSLIDMGLFAAYLPKPHGVAVVFTVQGTRKQIEELWEPLCNYLHKAGGAKNCSIKEERITHWWLSQPDVSLPPVIDHIEWSLC